MSSCDEITQCSICFDPLETLNNPKVLPCLHPFCFECLEKTFCTDYDPGDSVKCPLCRQEFCIPLRGIQDLPSHVQVSNSETINTSDKSSLCEMCSIIDVKNPSSAFCINCDQYICDRHSEMHETQPSFMSHRVLDGENLPSNETRKKVAVSLCEEHPDKPIEVYCFEPDCKRVACMMCYVENHTNHKCLNIKKAAESLCEQMEEDIENIKVFVSEIQKKIDLIETDKISFIEQISDVQNKISQKYDELLASIGSHKNELIKKLNSFKDRRLKKMECFKDEAEFELVSMDSYQRHCREIIDKGISCDIARSASDLHFKATEIVKSKKSKHERGYDSLGKINIKFMPLHLQRFEYLKNITGDLDFEEMPLRRIGIKEIPNSFVKITVGDNSTSGILFMLEVFDGIKLQGLLTDNRVLSRDVLLSDVFYELHFENLKKKLFVNRRDFIYCFTCDLLETSFVVLSSAITEKLEEEHATWLSPCKTKPADEAIVLIFQNPRDPNKVAFMEPCMVRHFGVGMYYSKLNDDSQFCGSPLMNREFKIIGMHNGKGKNELCHATNILYICNAINKDYERTLLYGSYLPTNRALDGNDIIELKELLKLVKSDESGINFMSPATFLVTPIWFRRTPHHWYWTPYNPPSPLNWMQICRRAKYEVIGGSYNGSKPAKYNCDIILYLARHGNFYL